MKLYQFRSTCELQTIYLASSSRNLFRRSAGPSPNKHIGSFNCRRFFFTSASSVLTLICLAFLRRSNSSSKAVLSFDLSNENDIYWVLRFVSVEQSLRTSLVPNRNIHSIDEYCRPLEAIRFAALHRSPPSSCLAHIHPHRIECPPVRFVLSSRCYRAYHNEWFSAVSCKLFLRRQTFSLDSIDFNRNLEYLRGPVVVYKTGVKLYTQKLTYKNLMAIQRKRFIGDVDTSAST